MSHLPTSSPRTSSPTAPKVAPTVAIVGSGPGGLTSAVLLAASGAKVTVFESQPVIGGRTARSDLEPWSTFGGDPLRRLGTRAKPIA